MNMERLVQYECKVCGRRIDVTRTGDVYEEPVFCCGVETMESGMPAPAVKPAKKAPKKKAPAKKAKKKPVKKAAKKKAKKKPAAKKKAKKKTATKKAKKAAPKKKRR